jgi:hypothetical protein
VIYFTIRVAIGQSRGANRTTGMPTTERMARRSMVFSRAAALHATGQTDMPAVHARVVFFGASRLPTASVFRPSINALAYCKSAVSKPSVNWS